MTPNAARTATLDAVAVSAPSLEHQGARTPSTAALERRRGAAYALPLGANEAILGSPPAVTAALNSASAFINRYGDPDHLVLRCQIAEQWGLSPEHVLIGSGGDSLIAAIVGAYVKGGTVTVSSDGAYETFRHCVTLCDGAVWLVPYGSDWRNDLEGLAGSAALHDAGIIYLANPDNPTGTLHKTWELEHFLSKIESHRLVLIDEAYWEFTDPADALPLSVSWPNVLRLRTFSKAYGLAGARIGYVTGSPEILARIARSRTSGGASALAADLAAAALSDSGHLSAVRLANGRGKSDYYKFAEIVNAKPIRSHGNFVSLDFGSPSRAARVQHALETKGVLVRRPECAPVDRLLRITVATADLRMQLAGLLLDDLVQSACADWSALEQSNEKLDPQS